MQSSKMFHFLSIGECIHLDLGMKNRGIPDSRITASSTLNANTPAMNGRLLYTAGSSWCAATNDNNPYLQIDLQSLHVICAVSTQGNSKADEWVETYTIQTSTDGVHWTEYGSLGHPKTFLGNNDSSSVEKNILTEGIVTRWLRIVGKTKHKKSCMRAEVFGVKRNPENLALNKPTRQSSDFNRSSGSENAVDGNRNPLFDANGSCALTELEDPSWLRVDLGTDYVPVSDVFIVNRLFPASAQQTNGYYQITLGDNNDVDRNHQCTGLVSFKDFIGSTVCYSNPLKTGRYLGILTTQGRRTLSLCEVEVYSRENIAFRKPTKQNDVGSISTRPSSRAVDGNSDTRLGLSCTASDLVVAFTNPWWRVDLEQVEPVNEVYIVNRGDCCGEGLNSFEIRVGLASSDNGITNPLCGSGLSVPQGKGVSFFCRPALFGQYVTIRVTRSAPTLLHICEVEVYSERRACQMQAVGITSSLAVPSQRLSASSSRVGFEPDKGRLYGDGAWSPIDGNNPDDFLQIDLQHKYFICAVATQGYPLTSSSFWTTKYRLLFSVNGMDWLTYKENGIDKIFSGNSGRQDIVKHNLKSFTKARFVRFQPTEFENQKALRVEVYGVPTPTAPSQAPTGFDVTRLTNTSVRASWKLPPVAIRGFKLLYRLRNSSDELFTAIILSNSTLSKDVYGLEKNAEYEFQVLAFTANGNGPLSSMIIARRKEFVPSQAPGNLTVTSQTSTSILASWQRPSTSDSAVITGYKIFYKRKGSLGSVYTLLIDDATKLSINVTGLLKYTEYEFQILAFTSTGDGSNSSSLTERTKEDVPSQAPANLSVASQTSTSILASWQLPPADSRNGIILGFKLFYKRKGSAESANTEIVRGGTTLRKTITGLLEYNEYEFQVLAFTAVGDGLKSSIRTARTGTVAVPVLKEDVSPAFVICKIGTLCSLSCYATSEFPRTVAYSWTKDGRSLANSRKIKIIDNSIVIRPQYMEDYGVYVCRASNGIYDTTCNVTLVEIQEGQILTAAVKKMESDSHGGLVTIITLSCAILLLLIFIGLLLRKLRELSSQNTKASEKQTGLGEKSGPHTLSGETDERAYMDLQPRHLQVVSPEKAEVQEVQEYDDIIAYYNIGLDEKSKVEDYEAISIS
ncbi:uncharacterized protein LOC141866672 isoform X2 [Acropora palmata]|uniref:uncharacterized protein LOC141866672 isoform X2 n=1 Tax=Acropora palmata TaxID=6131 RepID=UPI003D9FBC38